ncbi:MAG: prepilin peptidase [Planctomycetes bacterium]|nr:prepilin peptidase [Planctomycetota bacterium]
MPLDVPAGAWVALWAVLGLLVGSFLNVAIHRLPLEGETVSRPRRSRCPSCRTTLSWRENVPLVSWLVQRGRCRSCGWRIPWRYPLVEIANACLWGGVAWLALPARWELALVWSVALSALLVATAVDFDCFEIPDEISIGGIVAAPVASLLVPELHAQTWVAQWMAGPGAPVGPAEALFGALAGIAVGGGILWVIGVLGTKVYGRDAMGFGDVKLLAAGGGFVGPGGALFALVLGSLVASVVGLLNMGRFFLLLRARARARRRAASITRHLQLARIAGRYLPFGPYLALGIGIALVAWNHVATWIP